MVVVVNNVVEVVEVSLMVVVAAASCRSKDLEAVGNEVAEVVGE